MSAEFRARYSGTCTACDGPIKPGDRVRYGYGRETSALVHVECPELAELEELPGALCPRCYCRHRGEC